MIETKTGAYTYNEEEHGFNFVTALPSSMKVNFVESVTNALVTDKNYNSIIRNIIFDFYIIVAMTDVDVHDIADNGDIDEIEEFVNQTNIANIVKVNAEPGFIESLSDAVDINLEYRTGVQVVSVSKALISLLNTIENKVPEFDMEEVMATSGMLSELSDDFSAEKLLDAYAKSDVFRKYIVENKEVANNLFTSSE